MDHVQRVADWLTPLLAELGYTRVKRSTFTRGKFRGEGAPTKELLSITWENPNDELAMTRHPGVELYVSDAFPSGERSEIKLHVWNWIGMTGPCQSVVDHLHKRGVLARKTSRKGTKVVAVSLPSELQ